MGLFANLSVNLQGKQGAGLFSAVLGQAAQLAPNGFVSPEAQATLLNGLFPGQNPSTPFPTPPQPVAAPAAAGQWWKNPKTLLVGAIVAAVALILYLRK
jgi:hypothetical protein